jgi:hypothetical protein
MDNRKYKLGTSCTLAVIIKFADYCNQENRFLYTKKKVKHPHVFWNDKWHDKYHEITGQIISRTQWWHYIGCNKPQTRGSGEPVSWENCLKAFSSETSQPI